MAHAPNEPHPPCADLSAVEARYLLAILDLARAAGLSRSEADLLASSVSPALGRRLHAGRGRPPRPSDAQTNRPSPT